MGYRVSERRACRVTKTNRGMYRYRGHKDPRTALRIRIREIAQTRVRYGYRKIVVLLNREGWGVGKTVVQRLYQEEGLALKHRPKRHRRASEQRGERIGDHSCGMRRPGNGQRLWYKPATRRLQDPC